MAYEVPVLDFTFNNPSNLSSNQYYFVTKTTTNNEVDLSSAGDLALGILQNDPIANEGAGVRLLGISKVVAGGSITAGDYIAVGTGGTAITRTTENIVGFALESGASGEVISIYVLPLGAIV